MAKVDFNTISLYDLRNSGFINTLTKEEREKLNSVFKKSDEYDENTFQGVGVLNTKEETENFINGIGEDLYNKYKSFQKKKVSVEKIQNRILTPVGYNEKKYTEAIQAITPDNVLDVFADGCNIGDNTVYYFGNIGVKPWRKENLIKSDLNHVRTVLQELCKQKGIDCTELDKEKFKYIKEDGNWSCDYNGLLEKYLGLIYDAEYLKDKITPLLNTDNSRKLENAIETRYNTALKNNENLEWLVKNEKLFDTGNGKFDKSSMQMSGNCWLCAGLDSMIATPEGKAFLEKNMKRDNTRHLTAIHLQGAENAGLPKPKGDGVYVFSDKEIELGQMELSHGDGDFTAYNLAIAECKKEIEEQQYIKEQNIEDVYSRGGNIEGTYYILTGLESDENPGNLGISTRDFDFDRIYNTVKNGKGAAGLEDTDHAYSVVGTTDDGKLLIQESNQDKDWDRNKRFDYVKDSNPPTYKCSKEQFQDVFNGCAIFQWEK